MIRSPFFWCRRLGDRKKPSEFLVANTSPDFFDVKNTPLEKHTFSTQEMCLSLGYKGSC